MKQVTIDNIEDYILQIAKQSNTIDGETIFNIISQLECENLEAIMNSILIKLKKNGILIEESQTENNSNETKLNDFVAIYLNNISFYELLTFEEECELSKMIIEANTASILVSNKLGDSELVNTIERGKYAEEVMINHNLRLVVNVAKRYLSPGVELMDLIQEGNIGLMIAVKKYDYRLGYRFSTYAYNWIRQSISKFVKSSIGIKIPLYVQNELSIIKKKQNELMQELGCENVTIEQLSLALEGRFTIRRINELMSLNFNVISLDSPSNDFDNSKDLIEVIEDKTNRVYDYPIGWEKLTVKEQDIILLFYNDKVSLTEIAKKYGVSSNRIRQIKDRAKRKLEYYRREIINK